MRSGKRLVWFALIVTVLCISSVESVGAGAEEQQPETKPMDFKVSPARITLEPSARQIFTNTGKDEQGNPLKCLWTIEPPVERLIAQPGDGESSFPSHTVAITTPPVGGQTPNRKKTVAYTGSVTLKCDALGKAETALIRLTHPSATEPDEGADITTVITGFEQAGAVSADSDQQFFFDFFISRPLPGIHWSHPETFGPALRWWGDVRIASYPQQVNTPVARFAQEFGQEAGNVKVNEVARFGEFRSGLEFRFASLPNPFAFAGGKQRSALGLIVSYGALGAFHPPTGAATFASASTNSLITNLVPVFSIPTGDTPQAEAFRARYPVDKYPDLKSSGAQYVAFTVPDRNQFYRQYGAGIRLTTRFYNDEGELLSAPAMVTASFGQHELVAGGKLRGVVGKFEGFYPFRIKDSGLTIFLFGRGNLRIGGQVTESKPIVLPRAKDSSGNSIPITESHVAIIAEPSRRDMYTIGVGIDLASLIVKLTGR